MLNTRRHLYSEMMTPEQVKVASSSNLAALKAMVPNEVATDAIGMGEWGEQPLLSFAIIYHKCTDEGHAAVQYLIDQGASPNQENKLVGKLFEFPICRHGNPGQNNLS